MLRGRSALLACAFAAALGLAFASVASAGNDDGVLFGNAAVLSGGALTATVSDGSAVVYNPAGLALVLRDSVDVSGSAYQLRIGNASGIITTSNGGRADSSYIDFGVVPSAVTMVRRLSPDVVLGGGLFVPALRGHDEALSLVEPGGPSPEEWGLTLRDSDQTYFGGVCLGVRITGTLRVGFGLYGSYRQSTLSVSFSGGARDEMGMPTVGFALNALRWYQSLSLGLGAGIQWEPVPGLVLGASVISPQMALGSLARESRNIVVAGDGMIALEPSDTGSFEPSFEVATPMRLRIGVAMSAANVTVMLDGDVQHELSNPAVGVDRATTGGVRAGVRVDVDPSVTVGGGLFTDFNADRGVYSFGLTRAHFFGGSAGFELHNTHVLGEGESAPSIVFVQAFGVRYAYGVGHIGGIRVGLEDDPPIVVTAPATDVHEIALHVGSGLYF